MSGGWTDWIDEYVRYTEGIPSPEIFRLWAGIAGVAAALERRVWTITAGRETYPSLYTLLVGKPGTGKSLAISPISQLWYDTKTLRVASNSVTKASLTDELNDAKRLVLLKDGGMPIEFHSLQIAASEFGVLVPAHDLDFLNFLNLIYDNDPQYRESRRTKDRKIDAINPQINILAGTQPAYLAELLPEQAWGLGFMTRMIMIYSAQEIPVDLWGDAVMAPTIRGTLLSQMNQLLEVHGKVEWTPDAKASLQSWVNAKCPPAPEHSRLQAYAQRRPRSILKLAMVSAASAGHPLEVTLWDVERAYSWLFAAEMVMPDIFKEMVGKSDAQVLQELHHFVWELWVKDKKYIHETRLIYFLRTRAPADKIHRLIDIAVRANILDKDATEPLYKPRSKDQHGVE